MRQIYLLIILIGFTPTYSQFSTVNDLDISKLDSIFDAKEIDNKFMGTISVFKNNKEIYSRSTGYSDIENNIKSLALLLLSKIKVWREINFRELI